jgi:protein-S-isoprenylcysteine O-methyltransferase Ste14
MAERSLGENAAGAALFFILAPGSVAGLMPYLLTRWRVEAQLPIAVRTAGGFLIAVAVASVLESFARFVVRGRGTPAPAAPPTRLVVSGQYRYVRNPMYAALVASVLGQALVLGSLGLTAYAGLLLALFHLRVITYEEPKLAEHFGGQFRAYRSGVPRWLPRVTPWQQGTDLPPVDGLVDGTRTAEQTDDADER